MMTTSELVLATAAGTMFGLVMWSVLEYGPWLAFGVLVAYLAIWVWGARRATV